MNILPTWIFSLTLSCLSLAACVSADACMMRDTWWRSPENPGLFFDNKLPESNLAEVDISMQASAKAMLERSPFKEITKDEATKFSNGKLKTKVSSGLRYYLVRAVRLVEGGKFTAYRHASSIYILHGDLGLPRPAKRSVVVVAVQSEISDVFATCTTVE